MISRRTIRVKVMQTLYALESQRVSPSTATDTAAPIDTSSNDHQEELKYAGQILTAKFEQTKKLLVYLLHLIFEVAKYAERDAHQKASKHLPTQEDLAINTKISGNELLWQTKEHPEFADALKNIHADSITPVELVKKLYQQLLISEEYQNYIQTAGRDKKNERIILEYILNHIILSNEIAVAHLEEHFINWDDDAEQIHVLINNYFNRPQTPHFKDILGAEKREFAYKLSETVLEKKAYLIELIKPKLNNWDADRIAALDMIILKMGVSEFLFFETIPTKVTINEYIDLAKSYSTPQSGHFVNGLLDTLQKELMQQNKIKKIVYKNSTL